MLLGICHCQKSLGLGTWNPRRSHDQAHCLHNTWLQLWSWNKVASAANYLRPLNSRCMEGSQEPKFVTNHLFSPVMSSLAYMGERSLLVSTKRINGKDICVICVTDMWHHTKEITVCFWSPDCTVLWVNFSYNHCTQICAMIDSCAPLLATTIHQSLSCILTILPISSNHTRPCPPKLI
jgi:hypothetical protein